MTNHTPATAAMWTELNQAYLVAHVARLRLLVERYLSLRDRPTEEVFPDVEPWPDPLNPPALDRVATVFGLSAFERDLLLLCAAPELDGGFAAMCAGASGDTAWRGPTFSLALAALPGAHWSALSPGAPLRHWRLLEVSGGSSLTASPLRIDERILHEMTGVSDIDERLEPLAEWIKAADPVVSSHDRLAERIVSSWSESGAGEPVPAIYLVGEDVPTRRAIAARACVALGLGLLVLPATLLPSAVTERQVLLRLADREALLAGAALLLECDDVDHADPLRAGLVHSAFGRTSAPLVISDAQRRTVTPYAQVVHVDVPPPSDTERRGVWEHALGAVHSDALDGQLDLLASQFRLSAPLLHTVSTQTIAEMAESPSTQLSEALWDACRRQARSGLDDLAQRLEPAVTWDDLVVPEFQRATLHEIAAQVRQRERVYQQWGFAARGGRGLGISALFSGPTGTGKTMAAEVLAGQLRLDLYRIDLASTVSKYIGETEKNLRRIFDAAEGSGAILLFDEADALFGKRSEVKDSHDRYANIEISYLLQCMEAYRGLAILTTNQKTALDTAFLRRLRFVVEFPFPSPEQRAEIWHRVFPPVTPTLGIDAVALAHMNISGGTIRNIALNAAFLGAEAGQPVSHAHILRAARTEYAKLEKPLTDAELVGWAR